MKTHPSIGEVAIRRAMEQAASGDYQDVARSNPGAFAFMNVTCPLHTYQAKVEVQVQG